MHKLLGKVAVMTGGNSGVGLATAEALANACAYCMAARTAFGTGAGIRADEIQASPCADADRKVAAGLAFARRQRGAVSDDDLARIRAAGYRDGEIVEIVAHVALNILTNFFNLVAQAEVGFPRVPPGLERSA